MKKYTASYYTKDDVITAIFEAENLKTAKELAQTYKRHNSKLSKSKTEVRIKKD